MKRYKTIESLLTSTCFEMILKPEASTFKVEVKDSISNINVNDRNISFEVERKVNVSPDGNNVNVFVKLICAIETEEIITKEQFIKDIKADLGILNIAFAKASLIIANNSSMTSFGPILMVPAYDPKSIIII